MFDRGGRTWAKFGVIGAAVAALAAVGCSGGDLAKKTMPTAESAEQAIGDPKCTPEMIKEGGSPLIVDWEPSRRSDLEVAMKSGVVMASYTCEKGVKLLPDCTVPGEYGFVGVSVKSEKISIDSADDVGANFSLGAAIPVSFKAALTRGSSVHLGYMLIGKQSSVRDDVARADLKGRCDGATHFVRRADIGAFAMKSGAKADFDTALSVFDQGAHAASNASKDVDSTDGKPDACTGFDPDADTPPKECRAILRVTLLPISESAAKPADPLATDPECRPGYVLTDGKCTKKEEAKKPYLCKANDEADCLKQCKAGNDGSCDRWVRVIAREEKTADEKLKKDGVPNLQRFVDACEKSNLGAPCVVAAWYGSKDDKAAEEKYHTLGCRNGYYMACKELRELLLKGDKPNIEKFMKVVGSSCTGGQPEACGIVADEYFKGAHIKRNREKALKYAGRACEGGFAYGCIIQASLTVSPEQCIKLNGKGSEKDCENAKAEGDAKGLLDKTCTLEKSVCDKVKGLGL